MPFWSYESLKNFLSRHQADEEIVHKTLSDPTNLPLIRDIAGALLPIIEMVPWYANRLFNKEDIRKLIIEGWQVVLIIQAAPQCANTLLCDKRIRRLIETGDQVASIIKAAPQCANILLCHKRIRGLIETGDQVASIIKAAPLWANRLLSDNRIRKLIKKGGQVASIIQAAPQCADILLCHKRIRGLIQDGLQVTRIIKAAPQCADRLLRDDRIRGLIANGGQVASIIQAAPQCADRLLGDVSIQQILALASKKEAYKNLSSLLHAAPESTLRWLQPLTGKIWAQMHSTAERKHPETANAMQSLGYTWQQHGIPTPPPQWLAVMVLTLVRTDPSCGPILLRDKEVVEALGRSSELSIQVGQEVHTWVNHLIDRNRLEQIFDSGSYLTLGELYSGVVSPLKGFPIDLDRADACYRLVSKMSKEALQARSFLAGSLLNQRRMPEAISVLSEDPRDLQAQSLKDSLLSSYRSSAVSEVLRRRRGIGESHLETTDPPLEEKQRIAKERISFFGEFTARSGQDYAVIQHDRQAYFQSPTAKRLIAEI